jgi:hypothetical protein
MVDRACVSAPRHHLPRGLGTRGPPLLRTVVLDVLAACGEPAVGVPGPFQFAQPGTLSALLRRSVGVVQ